MSEFDARLVAAAAIKISRIKSELELLNNNRKEIYRISRMLPELEGYKLMALYDESMKTMNEAWSKMMK